ncbi:MAG TPA: RHS repeat-associated core domain-containing protein, partial [Acidimicrobiales bacterium]
GQEYDAGESVWRVRVSHFSTIDCNYGFRPPRALPPDPDPPPPDRPCKNPKKCKQSGSDVDAGNQSLGLTIPLGFAPYQLEHWSEMAPSRAARRARIPVTGEGIPPGFVRAAVTVRIAGQVHRREFPPEPKQVFEFVWDGLDALGRAVPGQQHAAVQIDHVYGSVLAAPVPGGRSFGEASGEPLDVPARQETVRSINHTLVLGSAWETVGAGLGGWCLDVHHPLDLRGGEVVVGGYGPMPTAGIGGSRVVTVLGTGKTGRFVRKPGPALKRDIETPYALCALPDGSFYFADDSESIVGIVRPDGTAELVVGGGDEEPGDGVAALEASLGTITSLAVDRAGVLHLGDNYANKVFAVRDGRLALVAGNGKSSGPVGDNGPAVKARLQSVYDLEFLSDGSLLISDPEAGRIRRVRQDGLITTFAGTGRSGAPKPGSAAIATSLPTPKAMAVLQGDAVLVWDESSRAVYRIRPDGIIDILGDAPPDVADVVADPNGGYVALRDNQVVRVDAYGRTGVIAGLGTSAAPMADDAQRFSFPDAVALARRPDGSLLVADRGEHKVFEVLPPGATAPLVVVSPTEPLHYVYDADLRHVATTTPGGATVRTFEYDGRLLVGVVEADGSRLDIVRDERGNPSAFRADGRELRVTCDADGRLASEQEDGWPSTSYAYDSAGRVVEVRGPGELVKTYAYDDDGLLVAATHPGGTLRMVKRVTEKGEELLVLDRNGDEWRYSADRDRKVIGSGAAEEQFKVVGPCGRSFVEHTNPSSTWRDDPLGVHTNVSSEIGVDTMTTEMLVSGPAGNSVYGADSTITRDRRGEPKTVTQRYRDRGLTWTVERDVAKRIARVEGPSGRNVVVHRRPDWLIEKIETSAGSVSFDYDGRGRVTSVKDSSGGRAAYEWSDRGELKAAEVDGNRVTNEFDRAGRLVKTENAVGAVTRTYDDLGRLATITAPTGATWRFEWDVLERLIAVHHPAVDGEEPFVERCEYDGEGRITACVTPRGRTETTYEGPQAFRTRAGDITLAVEAPSKGRVVSRSDAASTEVTLDHGSYPTSITWKGVTEGHIDFEYGRGNNVQKATLRGTKPVTFSYGGSGLPSTVAGAKVEWDDATGRVASLAIGKLRATRTAAKNGTITRRVEVGGKVLWELRTSPDDAGRVGEEVADGRASRYRYDEAGRLASAGIDGAETRYAYDAHGNAVSIGKARATYDARDRMGSLGEATLKWTADGCLESIEGPDGRRVLHWDDAGRLVGETTASGLDVRYVLDASGDRIQRSVDGHVTASWLRIDGSIAAELDAAGNVRAQFVYVSNTATPELMITPKATYCVVTDERGSVRRVVHATTGEIAQALEYDAYGRVLADTNPGFQPFGFAGGQLDPVTGVHRMGEREYDGSLTRWLQPDPAGPAQGTNLYLYAAADPVNVVDLDGAAPIWLAAFAAHVGWTAVWGAVVAAGAELAVELITANGNVMQLDPVKIIAAGGIGAIAAVAMMLPVPNPTLLAMIVGAIGGWMQDQIAQAIDRLRDPCKAFDNRSLQLATSLGGVFGVWGAAPGLQQRDRFERLKANGRFTRAPNYRIVREPKRLQIGVTVGRAQLAWGFVTAVVGAQIGRFLAYMHQYFSEAFKEEQKREHLRLIEQNRQWAPSRCRTWQ